MTQNPGWNFQCLNDVFPHLIEAMTFFDRKAPQRCGAKQRLRPSSDGIGGAFTAERDTKTSGVAYGGKVRHRGKHSFLSVGFLRGHQWTTPFRGDQTI